MPYKDRLRRGAVQTPRRPSQLAPSWTLSFYKFPSIGVDNQASGAPFEDAAISCHLGKEPRDRSPQDRLYPQTNKQTNKDKIYVSATRVPFRECGSCVTGGN